ncbi:MAG: NAD-dependent epimerase/dehydratase family protein [Gemmatimonadota bacterium]|nr:NAD-dependent epimerase/dehydratase family protein [Gemmatimonadota bacterium]
MRVLVTGGAGFIGSHFVEHFHKDHEVVVVDNLRTGYHENLQGLNHEFHQVSVAQSGPIRPLFEGVGLVVHLAALVSVPESMDSPGECIRINTLGTLNVLEAARAAGVKKVVFASSSAVYGDNPAMPKLESMLPEPMSPYAVTKLDGEYYMKIYRDQWGLQSCSLRFFNVFGPRQDPGSQYAAAIPIFISRALKGMDLVIYGDGSQVRDFVFVKDVVQACLLAAEKGEGTYNVASGSHITVQRLAEMIVELTGSPSKIIHAPERPGDIHTSYADISHLSSLGYQPTGDLRSNLLETIAFFENSPGRGGS